VAVLGIYLSVIIAGNCRLRNQQGIWLGLYLVCLAVLLAKLSAPLHPIREWSRILQVAGVPALFFLGPVSLIINMKRMGQLSKKLQYLHLFPALIITGYIMIDQTHEIWLYRAGIIVTGCYLVIQPLLFYRYVAERLLWNVRFTFLQLGVFIVICAALFSEHFRFIASTCLSVLILIIWIRLLYSAYLYYLINKS